MSKRRLRVLMEKRLQNRFRCDRLACTLTKEQCAQRSTRADQIEIDAVGHVKPQGWAHLLPCRHCEVGTAHQIEVGVLKPKQPRRVTPGDEAVTASRVRSQTMREAKSRMKFKVG